MFDYEKTLKKLTKFGELSEKKQKKILSRIFLEEDYRTWFYKLDESNTMQPMTGPMVDKLTALLIEPSALKKLAKFVETCDSFDQSAATLTYAVAEHAIESANSDSGEITDKYKGGEIDSKKVKEYKEKSDRYHEIIGRLIDAIKDRRKEELKNISKKTGLPREMIFATTLTIPSRKYILKYKVGVHTNQLLRDIYAWFGKNGYEENAADINWGPFFGYLFGNEMTSSAAISILLEGVRRIDEYRGCTYFDNVRVVWDSLTTFALKDLDNAPENTRRQLLDLYIKRLDNIARGNRGTIRLRVNLLNLPNEFSNLIRTVNSKSAQIASLMSRLSGNPKPINNDNHRPNNDPANNRNFNMKGQLQTPSGTLNVSAAVETDSDDDPAYRPLVSYDADDIEETIYTLKNSAIDDNDDDDDD